MKKLTMIFSAIFVTHSLSGFPFKVELQILITRYLQSSKQPTTSKSPQAYIEEHKKELITYFSSTHNPIQPLPFVACTDPAIFDIAKSHTNQDLFEQALANPHFDPRTTVNGITNANLFHVCCSAGTNKFLKRLFNYCKEHRINYRPLMNTKNNNGMTPLGLAAQFSRTKCLSLLLSHGSSIEAQPGSLMHFAVSARIRGETKRNAVVQRLCEHDELLATVVSSNRCGAEEVANLFNFKSTGQLIKSKKIQLIEQLHEEDSLYFKTLPAEIFNIALKLAFDPQSLAALEDAKSQPV